MYAHDYKDHEVLPAKQSPLYSKNEDILERLCQMPRKNADKKYRLLLLFLYDMYNYSLVSFSVTTLALKLNWYYNSSSEISPKKSVCLIMYNRRVTYVSNDVLLGICAKMCYCNL